MRVPLDYYRILGLPLQATVDQVQQAHRDRLLQVHRRGYSEAAIAARKQLIDEAYAVLSDSEQRQTYNLALLGRGQGSTTIDSAEDTGQTPPQEGELSLPQFSANRPVASTVERSAAPQTLPPPTLEIADDLLVGALMILLELGQYEIVLTLAQPYLGNRGVSFKHLSQSEPSITQVDIVLTVSLAYLELGREQWHQGQYENAAASLDAGQDLLLREGVFAHLRGEIQTDLYKLRPYRVLELLALSQEQVAERRHGLKLLCDMLQERGGIDGTGKDQSGLSVDDFLRFIQQLRSYLTTAEQQILFEEEARRPSAVATYLAVYALIARGFTEYQPALVRRAKTLLSRLSNRQDVYLEQAVCSLLLGQTLEASRALEASQEEESLLFIEEHSQGSPDLLPGLCLYCERWLQEEVFPHFRDLTNRRASLKDYFADEQVQAYLEELPNEPATSHDWEALRTSRANPRSSSQTPTPIADPGAKSINGWKPTPATTARFQSSTPSIPNEVPAEEAVFPTSGGTNGHSPRTPPSRDREVGNRGEVSSRRTATDQRAAAPSPSRASNSPGRGGQRLATPAASQTTNPPFEGRANRSQTASIPTAHPGQRGGRSFLIGLLLLLGLGALAGVGVKAYEMFIAQPSSPDQPVLEAEQPMVDLSKPLVAIPAPDNTAFWKEPLDKKNAEKIVQAWLAAKSLAMGKEHDPSKLKQVLADPVLSRFQKLSEEAKRDNWYWQYKYRLSINSAQTSTSNPNSAEIEAAVNETAELFENGVLNQAASADRDLKVRYQLIRQNGEWRIQDIVVLR